MRSRIKNIVALVLVTGLLAVLFFKVINGAFVDPDDEFQRLVDTNAFSRYIGTEEFSQTAMLEKIEELGSFPADELQGVEGTKYLYDGLDPDWCIHFKVPQTVPPIEVWGHRNTDLYGFPNLSKFGVPESEDIDYYCGAFKDVGYSWGTITAHLYCVFTQTDSEGLVDVYYLSIQ